MSHIRERLGKNTTRLRQERGLTQARLAEKVEISPTFMMHIEHGTRGASLETVELLANALEVDISELFIDFNATLYTPQWGITRYTVENMLIEETTKAIQNCINTLAEHEKIK
jgi:transcriptional regulator with XRE-family HTH domain